MSSTPSDPTAPRGPQARAEADILADARLHAHLSDYHPSSVESLLKEYARLTQELVTYGEQYEQQMESRLHETETEAYERLWDIQRKKLFNLQCLWRAEQVELPGVELTAQFWDWADHIEQCPLLDPIHPDDVALYDAFLAQLDDPDDLEADSTVQYYWLFRDRHNPNDPDEMDALDDELPAWFHYYDQHRGTTALLQLPDVRGTREAVYLKEAQTQRAEVRRAAHPAPPPDPRPWVPWQKEQRQPIMRELLRRFDDPRLLRYYESYCFLNEVQDDQEEVKDAYRVLKNAEEPVPIEAHANWRRAIVHAANRYQINQLRRALARVYEQYCQREALGIQHADPNPPYGRARSATRYYDHDRELILEARAARGEPRDLNF